MIDDYVDKMMSTELSGIEAEDWVTFLKEH